MKLELRKAFEAGQDGIPTDGVMKELAEAARSYVDSLPAEKQDELNERQREDIRVAFHEGFWEDCHADERKALRKLVKRLSRVNTATDAITALLALQRLKYQAREVLKKNSVKLPYSTDPWEIYGKRARKK